MSDPDAMPDPIDQAYVEAEAVLSDDAARAARRARVLAAVGRQGAPTPVTRPPLWRRGGWLIAAGVSALAVFVAVQVYRPPVNPPPVKPLPAPAAPAPETRGTTIAPAPAPVQTPAPATEVAQRVAAKTAAAPPPVVVAPSPAPPLAPPSEAAAPAAPVDEPAPPPPPPPADSATEQAAPAKAASPPQAPSGGVDNNQNVGEIVVTAEKRQSPRRSAPVAITAFTGRSRDLADPGARLRAAAAAGRTREVESLLKQGAPVDAADADGDTALMKSVESDHPAVAALLRRHGASLDQQNHAGESARDMARNEGDAALDQALGVAP